MKDILEYDEERLKHILAISIRYHEQKNIFEKDIVNDIENFFILETIDAIENEEKAKKVISIFSDLRKWLSDFELGYIDEKTKKIAKFYEGFIFSLLKMLSLKYGEEKISRKEFDKDWEATLKNLKLKK